MLCKELRIKNYVQGELDVLSFVKDRQNSVRLILNEKSEVIQEASYSAYGETQILERGHIKYKVENSFYYTSRELESETGDYYYRARYYSPVQGRFLSEDPIGFRGGDTNLYRYVKNNPVKFTDPSGTNPWAVVGEILLGIFGLDYDDAATGNAGGCPLNSNENREIEQMTEEENLRRLLNGQELPPVNVTPGDLITPINPNIPGIIPGPA